MGARLRTGGVRGPALLAFLLFASAGCGGCDSDPDAYPDSFVYPPRQDWIVLELPKDVPNQPEPAGELDEAIQRINERGGKVRNPEDVPESLRDQLNGHLRNSFGTPAEPKFADDDESKNLANELGLSPEKLAIGSKLFRKHCQQCHGVNGNGRGPTAPWITPHPRDFRQGVFKFVSTNGTGPRKPTRDDLFHTLTNGLPGTQMPMFKLRSEEERQRLIDYVIYLSVRGRTEFEILRTLLVHGEAGLNRDLASDAKEITRKELKAWQQTNTDVMPVTRPNIADGSSELSASIVRGHTLFLDQKGAACVTCHVNYGRDTKLQYDVWGTLIKPGDLTDARRKGGTAPEQLYRRIHGGIGPSNMPAAIALSESQTWDVVHFLQALPYPDRLPQDVKKRVYSSR